MSKLNRRYGWKRQNPDFRDFKFAARSQTLAALPTKVDLRSGCPTVVNQGSLGSCTANAIGGAHHFNQLKQKDPCAFAPSRLFIYWNERQMEGTINEDAGAIIRDGIKSVAKQGVCAETMWPYDIERFKDKPSQACYTEALKHQVLSYHAVSQSLEQLKACLAEGYPIVFGFAVYESFETEEVTRTGMMPMPASHDAMLGGHAVLIVGYDDDMQRFIVRNSWGEEWGDKGYFYMPYAYAANSDLASDFWTIRTVEDEDCPVPTPTPTPPTPTPDPEPSKPCDCSLAFPAAKAFVDAAVKHADAVAKITGSKVTVDKMFEAGLRGLQHYLNRVDEVRKHQAQKSEK